jgi:hypothetical protein
MTPELSLVVAAATVLAFTVGLGIVILRVPRCPGCRRPGVGEVRAIAEDHPSVVEVIYRCRVCQARLGRRTLGLPEA